MGKVVEGIGDLVCVGDGLVAMGSGVDVMELIIGEVFPQPVIRNIRDMDSMIIFFICVVLSSPDRILLHKVRLAGIKPWQPTLKWINARVASATIHIPETAWQSSTALLFNEFSFLHGHTTKCYSKILVLPF
jgi:hypothetical protein